MENLAIEILKVISSVAWFLLAVTLLAIFYRPIRDELIPGLSGFEGYGGRVLFRLGDHELPRGIN